MQTKNTKKSNRELIFSKKDLIDFDEELTSSLIQLIQNNYSLRFSIYIEQQDQNNQLAEAFLEQAQKIVHPKKSKRELLSLNKEQYDQLTSKEEERVFENYTFSLTNENQTQNLNPFFSVYDMLETTQEKTKKQKIHKENKQKSFQKNSQKSQKKMRKKMAEIQSNSNQLNYSSHAFANSSVETFKLNLSPFKNSISNINNSFTEIPPIFAKSLFCSLLSSLYLEATTTPTKKILCTLNSSKVKSKLSYLYKYIRAISKVESCNYEYFYILYIYQYKEILGIFLAQKGDRQILPFTYIFF